MGWIVVSWGCFCLGHWDRFEGEGIFRERDVFKHCIPGKVVYSEIVGEGTSGVSSL